jgi:hypothetical protein
MSRGAGRQPHGVTAEQRLLHLGVYPRVWPVQPVPSGSCHNRSRGGSGDQKDRWTALSANVTEC